MQILGVRIDNLEKKEILERISNFLDEPRFHQIATVNPEFTLEAQKNEKFQNILNASDLNVADGMGIRFAFWRHGEKLQARIAGADLMLEILRLAEEKNLKIFLAARKDGLSTWQETREAILKIYPNLQIEGANLDCHSRENGNPVANQSVSTLDSRRSLSSQSGGGNDKNILFCNFGAPHQEFFINRVKCDTIRLAIGVGGSFDFLTGKVCRAPKWMRKMGLEWLWRLILQPKRIGRIFRAVIVFPFKVVFSK